MNLVLRAAIPEDTPILLEIEQNAFGSSNWAAEDFLRYRCIVAESEHKIVGFLVVREVYDGGPETQPEREILNLAVAENVRRVGVASVLLRAELLPPATYFLEVRESNHAARALYRRFGFVEVFVRKEYYSNPVETAIVMSMKKC